MSGQRWAAQVRDVAVVLTCHGPQDYTAEVVDRDDLDGPPVAHGAGVSAAKAARDALSRTNLDEVTVGELCGQAKMGEHWGLPL